jgi:hypothetical protein
MVGTHGMVPGALDHCSGIAIVIFMFEYLNETSPIQIQSWMKHTCTQLSY